MNENFKEKTKIGIPMMIMGGPRPIFKKTTNEIVDNDDESI